VAHRVESRGPNGGVVGRPCVVKRILPELSHEREFVARFEEEAAIAVQLRHACVLRVLEIGCWEGRHYLALEYVDGVDLRRFLVARDKIGGLLPVGVALYIGYQLLRALAYAHSLCDSAGRPLGLIHRDISPSNVLVSRYGDVKLIDFGLAKTRIASVSTRPNVLFGKIGYLSPEQARGGAVDQRSDIYSVAAVLYELLTGRRLLNVDSETELAALMAGRLEPPSLTSVRPALPAELDPVLRRALMPDPARRYANVGEFQLALMPYLGMSLPELRILTGRLTIETVGPGARSGMHEVREEGPVKVEGSAERTRRRARLREAPESRPSRTSRSEVFRVLQLLAEDSRSPSRRSSRGRSRRRRRFMGWMIGAALLVLALVLAFG
jgi:serine/threonine protein kinase